MAEKDEEKKFMKGQNKYDFEINKKKCWIWKRKKQISTKI